MKSLEQIEPAEKSIQVEGGAEHFGAMSEQEYLDMAVKYALSVGWVKEKEKDILINDYLKPIYAKYLEIIKDLHQEGLAVGDITKIVTKMNRCLEATRRIGSTEPNNIVRTIRDYQLAAKNNHEEYALTLLSHIVSEVVYK